MPRKQIEVDGELEELKQQLLQEAIDKLDDVVQEEEVVENEDLHLPNVPQRYIANLYWQQEPVAKDIFAGSYVYWDSTDEITFEALTPQYSTDLELLSTSDILVTKEGQSYLVSRWENPKEWTQNLPWAALGQRYFCKDVVVLDETE